MAVVRSMLALGNVKLGGSIHHFDLPAVTTCPGRTSICEGVCYAHEKGRYRFKRVLERLRWCWEQSLRDDFVERMIREIRSKGCLVVRVHVSGDFYSPEYSAKWLEVMQACKRVKFYFYTRSWRVASIVPTIEAMAKRANCKAWYSTDSESGTPAIVPEGVRLAYLQTEADDQPNRLDLRFTIRRLRRLALPMACPHETHHAENCGDCGRCFR